MKRLSAAIVACLAIAAPATALTVVESTDFSDVFGSPTNVGTLALGSNTVSGSLDATCDRIFESTSGNFCVARSSNNVDLVDAFSFDVGAGQELFSAVLTISNLVGYSAGSASTFDTKKFPGAGGTTEMMLGGPVTGTHTFEISSLITPNYLDYSMDWSLELKTRAVADVPLPAGGLLLISAAGAIGLIRRSRSA